MTTTKTIIHYKAGTYLPISENWIYSQIKGLRELNPIVYCHDIENLDIFPVGKIRSTYFKKSIYKLFSKAGLYNFNAVIPIYLKMDKPAIIQAHFGPSGYLILKYKKLFKIPLVTTFYGYDINALPKSDPAWLEKYKQLFQHGDHFLVEGTHMKKSLVKLGCPEEKITVQHLGIDLNTAAYKPRMLKNKEEIKILLLGRFTEKKGMPYAIEAIGKLKKKLPEIKLKVTIIGDSSGSAREEIEKNKILEAIEKYNLSDIVTLLGSQPHEVFIKELYKHHIFLSPSVMAENGDSEGGVPVSIIEATASGMPVVSTFHCDIPEVIINNVNGYLVEEKDTDALAEKLEQMIKNRAQWPEMGWKGRLHIEKNYDINKQVRSLEKIYFDVINSSK